MVILCNSSSKVRIIPINKYLNWLFLVYLSLTDKYAWKILFNKRLCVHLLIILSIIKKSCIMNSIKPVVKKFY